MLFASDTIINHILTIPLVFRRRECSPYAETIRSIFAGNITKLIVFFHVLVNTSNYSRTCNLFMVAGTRAAGPCAQCRSGRQEGGKGGDEMKIKRLLKLKVQQFFGYSVHERHEIE